MRSFTVYTHPIAVDAADAKEAAAKGFRHYLSKAPLSFIVEGQDYKKQVVHLTFGESYEAAKAEPLGHSVARILNENAHFWSLCSRIGTTPDFVAEHIQTLIEADLKKSGA